MSEPLVRDAYDVVIGLDAAVLAAGYGRVHAAVPGSAAHHADADPSSALSLVQGFWVGALVVLGIVWLGAYGYRLRNLGGSGVMAVGLQAGGAAGNVMDRQLISHVTDYLSVDGHIIFNLADMALAAGIIFAAAPRFLELLITGLRRLRVHSPVLLHYASDAVHPRSDAPITQSFDCRRRFGGRGRGSAPVANSDIPAAPRCTGATNTALGTWS